MTVASASATQVAPPAAPGRLRRSALRRRALSNVLKVGHCAPTVMKTLVDDAGEDGAWLVRLVEGLPGGIGNSGHECGAITASLVALGLRHARDPDQDGVPVVVSKGRALLQEFRASHGSCSCRDLLVLRRLPLRCLGIVRLAPERCVAIDGRDCAAALPADSRRACALLHAHFAERDFHCAHAVLRHARGAEALGPPLLDATSAFVGGTAYAGLTCSALVAGVMLLGLAYGGVEHGGRRVVRALAGMALGGHAFAGDLEALNGAMDEGHALVAWFRERFGSTQCLRVAAADFASLPDVRRYVESGGVDRCRELAEAVAARVRALVEQRAMGAAVVG